MRDMHTHQGTTFHPKALPLSCGFAFTFRQAEREILPVKPNYLEGGSWSPCPL